MAGNGRVKQQKSTFLCVRLVGDQAARRLRRTLRTSRSGRVPRLLSAWAIDQMKQQPQGLQHTRIENSETRAGYPYFINEYRRERGYDRVERVAYVQLPDAVAYIVLTAMGEALFAEHKDALNETVQSLLYTPSFIGFDAKMGDALQGQILLRRSGY